MLMMRKHISRKPASHRKPARGRAKFRIRRGSAHAPPVAPGFYDPNRGEATS